MCIAGTAGGGQSSEAHPGSYDSGKLTTIGGAPPLRAAEQDSLSGERQETWASEAKECKGEVWGTTRS